MIHNSSRRQFMFGCLGFFPALGASVKSLQVSIPSVQANLPEREKEDVADAIQSQVSNSSDLPKTKFDLGQEVKYRIDDFDGETLIERGTVVGMVYEMSTRKRLEWVYVIRWSHCHNATHNFSWVPNQNEPDFLHEDDLVAV
jgi:hypothetical protein